MDTPWQPLPIDRKTDDKQLVLALPPATIVWLDELRQWYRLDSLVDTLILVVSRMRTLLSEAEGGP